MVRLCGDLGLGDARRRTLGHQVWDAGTCGTGTRDVKYRDAGTLNTGMPGRQIQGRGTLNTGMRGRQVQGRGGCE